MSFFRNTTLHRRMVGVKMRIVTNLECRRRKSSDELGRSDVSIRIRNKKIFLNTASSDESLTLSRMASSTGVGEVAVVDDIRSAVAVAGLVIAVVVVGMVALMRLESSLLLNNCI